MFLAILEQLHKLKKEAQTEGQAANITEHVLLMQVFDSCWFVYDTVLAASPHHVRFDNSLW